MDNDLFSPKILDRMLSSSSTEDSKSYVMALAKLLMNDSLKNKNAFIFFKILNLNFKEASDIIFSRRSPETFFSILEPNREIITSSLEILTKYSPNELYEKNILCCLGILDNAFKKAKYGLSLYNLSVADIQHIAKYLILKNKKINSLILDFLNYIRLVQDHDNKYKLIVITAKDISDSYYDNKKDISKVIPQNLLI